MHIRGLKELGWLKIRQDKEIGGSRGKVESGDSTTLQSQEEILKQICLPGESTIESSVGFLLDTNIFNKILSGRIELPKSFKYYITHIQCDEILNIRDDEMRRRIIELLKKMVEEKVVEVIPTVVAVWDVSRWDVATLVPEEVFEKLCNKLKESKPMYYKAFCCENQIIDMERQVNKIRDVLMLITACENKLTLVTEDKDLRKAAEKLGCHVITFKQLLEEIRKK